MTSKAEPKDYWRCAEASGGLAHDWIYRGKMTQSYRCRRCGISVSKVDLKVNTDA